MGISVWKKTAAVSLMISSLAFGVTACGSSSGNSTNGAGGKTIVLKYSSQDTPQSVQVQAMHVFADAIQKSTNGQIKVQIYDSGSLYGQDAEIPALERGDLQMANVSAAQMSQQVPYTAMFAAAYTFKDYNAMTKTFNGDIGKKVFSDVATKTGARPLSAWYLGSRELNYRNIGHDVVTPADLKGVKLRMPNSPAWLALGNALGANPVPLAFSEVYTSLQTGTIDAQDNPLTTDKTSKFYEVAKNISLTNHVVDSIWPAINEKVWEKLTPDQQQKMYAAMEEGRKYMDEHTIQGEKDMISFFKQNGVKVVNPDLNAFQQAAQKYYMDHPETRQGWDMNLYNQVQDINKSVN